MGLSKTIQAEAEAILEDSSRCLQGTSALGRNWGKINMPTVVRKGTGRINVPNRSGTPKRPPRSEAEAKFLKENISLPAGEPASGGKIVDLAGLEGYEED
jgi:hypothetical protein